LEGDFFKYIFTPPSRGDLAFAPRGPLGGEKEVRSERGYWGIWGKKKRNVLKGTQKERVSAL